MIDRVKKIIRQKGLTMEKVATAIGIERTTLTRNLQGNPTLETLNKIADALGIPVKTLFDDEKISGIIKVNDSFKEISSVKDLKDILKELE